MTCGRDYCYVGVAAKRVKTCAYLFVFDDEKWGPWRFNSIIGEKIGVEFTLIND